jgi:DNA invertase Pin-like site-specific DNA recombinase
MTKKSKALVQRIAELDEANEHLRTALLRHKQGLAQAAKRAEAARWSVEAVQAGGAPEIRNEVTQAIDAFEAARHQVRLAMFALGIETGASISEIARSLGISRQLGSKLAKEAKELGL